MQPYECHFGFGEPPFSLTPDPRFFYATPAYREAYATLRYGIEGRKGFVLITGDAGTGKTTLLRMLMQEMDSSIQAAFLCNPPGTFTELLRIIMNELELPELSNDRVAVTAQFNEYLLEQLRKDRIVSVLVDEAQNLTQSMLEELRLLSNFETHKSKLIQMVVVGQPELELSLEKPELRQLKQRIALRCALKPLRPDEIAHYIDFRLAVAGYAGRDLFDGGGVAKIALYTRGIPRLINVICDNALLRACERKAGEVSVEMIDEAARDLWLVEPQRATLHVSDSGASPTSLSSAADASVNPPRRTDFDPWIGAFAQRMPRFRKSINATVLAIGLWMIVIGILAVAGANFYTANDQELLTLAADDAEAPAGGILPRVDFNEDRESGIGISSLENDESPRGDGTQDAVNAAPNQIWQGAKRGMAAVSKRYTTKGEPTDDSQPVESRSTRTLLRSGHEEASRSRARIGRDQALGIFNVVGSSFVRDKPSADAEITGALEPGTRVQVISKAGEYFRVRGLGRQMLSGYVHVEDAFFERSK